MEVNDARDNCLVTDILQNIFFDVSHSKEMLTGLEQLEDE